MINGIHHVALVTHDLDRLVGFYRDTLGFEVVSRTEWRDSEAMDRIVGLTGSAARVAMLRTGNAYVEIFEYVITEGLESSRAANRVGFAHICLDVTDIEAEYARLLKAGMLFNCPPYLAQEYGLQGTYGHDPDGNIIEIQQTIGDRSGLLLAQLEHLKSRS